MKRGVLANRRWTRIRHIIAEDARLKTFSILIAIALFYLVRGSEDEQRSVLVDVVTVPPPPSSRKILVTELPDRVKLTLRGSRWLLSSVLRERLDPVQIDLRDPSVRYYYFDRDAFGLPTGVTLVQIEPSSVPLVWENVVEEQVRIDPKFVGEPRPGFTLRGPATVTPSVIVVKGPETRVQGLDRVFTEPVNIGGLGAGVHLRTVALEPPLSKASYAGKTTVEVRFEITPELVDKEVHAVEVVAHNGRNQVEIRPDRVSVTLRGPREQLSSFNDQSLVAYVDLASQTLSRKAMPLRVYIEGLPEGIELVEVDPSHVLVRGGAF